MFSIKNLSLGVLAVNGALITANRIETPLKSSLENQHLIKTLKRARRGIVPLRDENSDLGAELALFYDTCSQSDLEKYVLKNQDNTKVSCTETKGEGLSCVLSCDAGYYVQETSEESRNPSVVFKVRR